MQLGNIQQLTVNPLPPYPMDFGRDSFQPSPLQGVEHVFIRVKKLRDTAKVPQVMQEGDVAADLYAAEPAVVPVGGRALIKTGLAISLAPGFRARFHSRSGLSWKHGIEVGAGLIDNSYRNELCVVLFNHGQEPFRVEAGDRVAQMCVERYELPLFVLTNELDETSRTEGFGSSGTR